MPEDYRLTRQEADVLETVEADLRQEAILLRLVEQGFIRLAAEYKPTYQLTEKGHEALRVDYRGLVKGPETDAVGFTCST